MTINLGTGGPVVLQMSITGKFSWNYTAILSKDEEEREFTKKGLKSKSASVELVGDAAAVKGYDLVVIMTLYNPGDEPSKTTVKADVSVAGTIMPPPVIDLPDATVVQVRSFVGTRTFV